MTGRWMSVAPDRWRLAVPLAAPEDSRVGWAAETVAAWSWPTVGSVSFPIAFVVPSTGMGGKGTDVCGWETLEDGISPTSAGWLVGVQRGRPLADTLVASAPPEKKSAPGSSLVGTLVRSAPSEK